MRFLIIIYFFAICDALAQVGYKIGDKVSNFSLVNISDNGSLALDDLLSYKGTVIIFTNNSCPYSKLYEERLILLMNQYASDKIKFLFINPGPTNGSQEDTPAALLKYYRNKKYTFPLLLDPQKKVSYQFGAAKTPETFVLKNINGAFIVLYKGAIDDNPQVAGDVACYYLKDAINDLINDNALKVVEKRASGCMIRE